VSAPEQSHEQAPSRSWCRRRQSLVLDATSCTIWAYVLELVFKLDLLGDGDAVLGDARGAVCLVDDDIAPLRTESDLYRVGKDTNAARMRSRASEWNFTSLASHRLPSSMQHSAIDLD
jgi:hypothetical protein